MMVVNFMLNVDQQEILYLGKGEVISSNERSEGHYRRFIDFNELKSRLIDAGFEIEESLESNGLAIYKDDDPVVIRIIAKKK